MRAVKSEEAVANRLPSDAHAAAQATSSKGKGRVTATPVLASHSRSSEVSGRPSLYDVLRILSLDGLHCASYTGLPTGRLGGSARPIFTDQIRTVRSWDAVATVLPFESSCASVIRPPWKNGSVWG